MPGTSRSPQQTDRFTRWLASYARYYDSAMGDFAIKRGMSFSELKSFVIDYERSGVISRWWLRRRHPAKALSQLYYSLIKGAGAAGEKRDFEVALEVGYGQYNWYIDKHSLLQYANTLKAINDYPWYRRAWLVLRGKRLKAAPLEHLQQKALLERTLNYPSLTSDTEQQVLSKRFAAATKHPSKKKKQSTNRDSDEQALTAQTVKSYVEAGTESWAWLPKELAYQQKLFANYGKRAYGWRGKETNDDHLAALEKTGELAKRIKAFRSGKKVKDHKLIAYHLAKAWLESVSKNPQAYASFKLIDFFTQLRSVQLDKSYPVLCKVHALPEPNHIRDMALQANLLSKQWEQLQAISTEPNIVLELLCQQTLFFYLDCLRNAYFNDEACEYLLTIMQEKLAAFSQTKPGAAVLLIGDGSEVTGRELSFIEEWYGDFQELHRQTVSLQKLQKQLAQAVKTALAQQQTPQQAKQSIEKVTRDYLANYYQKRGLTAPTIITTTAFSLAQQAQGWFNTQKVPVWASRVILQRQPKKVVTLQLTTKEQQVAEFAEKALYGQWLTAAGINQVNEKVVKLLQGLSSKASRNKVFRAQMGLSKDKHQPWHKAFAALKQDKHWQQPLQQLMQQQLFILTQKEQGKLKASIADLQLEAALQQCLLELEHYPAGPTKSLLRSIAEGFTKQIIEWCEAEEPTGEISTQPPAIPMPWWDSATTLVTEIGKLTTQWQQVDTIDAAKALKQLTETLYLVCLARQEETALKQIPALLKLAGEKLQPFDGKPSTFSDAMLALATGQVKQVKDTIDVKDWTGKMAELGERQPQLQQLYSLLAITVERYQKQETGLTLNLIEGEFHGQCGIFVRRTVGAVKPYVASVVSMMEEQAQTWLQTGYCPVIPKESRPPVELDVRPCSFVLLQAEEKQVRASDDILNFAAQLQTDIYQLQIRYHQFCAELLKTLIPKHQQIDKVLWQKEVLTEKVAIEAKQAWKAHFNPLAKIYSSDKVAAKNQSDDQTPVLDKDFKLALAERYYPEIIKLNEDWEALFRVEALSGDDESNNKEKEETTKDSCKESRLATYIDRYCFVDEKVTAEQVQYHLDMARRLDLQSKESLKDTKELLEERHEKEKYKAEKEKYKAENEDLKARLAKLEAKQSSSSPSQRANDASTSYNPRFVGGNTVVGDSDIGQTSDNVTPESISAPGFTLS